MYVIDYVSYRCSKAELYSKIKPFCRHKFVSTINQIIAKKRGKPFDEVKYVSYLSTNEVLAFLEEIDFDKDEFAKRITFTREELTKKDLHKKMSMVSEIEINEILQLVMPDFRQEEWEAIKNVRQLRRGEIIAFLIYLQEHVPVGRKKQPKSTELIF